jgi:hypothetical protein
VSLPESSSEEPRGVLVRRPQTTIYTILLFIALMALVISCLILAWELFQYDLQFNPPANLRSAAPVVTQTLFA